MCMTCGCMMPEDSMGSPENITLGMLRKAAKSGGKKNIKEVVDQLNKTYQRKVKGTKSDTEVVA